MKRLLVVLVALSGCATVPDTIEIARRQASKSADAFADAFDAYDLKRQEQILLETPAAEVVAAITKYQDEVQKPVRQALHDTHDCVAALGEIAAAWRSGKQGDWGAVLGKLAAIAVRIAGILSRHGIQLAAPKLVSGLLLPLAPQPVWNATRIIAEVL